MSEGEKIIYAAAAGFTVWIIQKIISYLVIRSRINQSILSDIKLNIDQIKEAFDYLKKFEGEVLLGGTKLGYIDKFNKTESNFYKSQINDLPKYYSRKTLDKINKFYYSFWELQILIEGLMTYLNYLTDNDIELTKTEIERAKRKLTRIYKLMEIILKNKINSISDLIENYEGRLGPDSML